MKITTKLLLLLAIICSNTLPKEFNLTPKNTYIVSDIDDVLIKKSGLLSAVSHLKSLAGDYTKDADGIKEALKDKKGNAVSGFTFHLLYHGMRKPYLTPYVSWMVKNLEKSRNFIDGTEKIYRYLKNNKDYTIVFATNKDRISYDITAQALGNKFTSLTSKTFVAHPGNSSAIIEQLQTFADLPTTSASYKKLLHEALTIQPTETILHAPGKKPELQYYHYVEQNLGEDKNMIFIDDRKDNIEGFNKLQKDTTALRHGIHFKNPQQLAEEFVTLGILSEVDDHALLQDIRYPGIWGKIRLNCKKLIDNVTIPATNH